jgi:prepilin-type processing-associated H-X9-DG protein
MPHSARIAWGLAACLAVGGAARLGAQMAATDTAGLEFHGFHPGAQLAEVTARVAHLDGAKLHCEHAKVDRRITECRGILTDPDLGGQVEVWLSAVDSVTSVLTLSGDVAPDQFEEWRSRLESRYGHTGAKVRGPQWMMQWIRHGRMIRLTWRVDHGSKTASVALVDGHVLDAWGRERARRQAQRPPRS